MSFVYNIKLSFLLSVAMVPTCIFSQREIQQIERPDLPQFYFESLSFSSDQKGMSRLDVYVEVPYGAVHFTNDGALFKASYDITVDIYDSLNNLVSEKGWTENVEVNDYESSISPHKSRMSLRSLSLSPGNYIAAVQISDNDTKKTLRSKQPMVLKDFSGQGIAVSDLMLVRRVETEGEKRVVYPNITSNVGETGDCFYVFFEVYDQTGADSAVVEVNVRSTKGLNTFQDTYSQVLGAPRKSCFCTINTAHLMPGDYTVQVDLRGFKNGSSGFVSSSGCSSAI